MRKLNEAGSLVLPLAIMAVLLLSTLIFGIWAFAGMQDYKTNSDKKSAVAVAKAVKEEDVKKDAEFAEKEKSPVKSYSGPATFGSIVLQYPKTWSAYIEEASTASSSTPVNGYFSPNFVPAIQSASLFALRVQVVNTGYVEVLKSFDSAVKSGKASVAAYRAPKVPGVLGSMVSGSLTDKKTGSMVILPLRDKTIKIWTEGADFNGDFNSIVLAGLTFIP